MRKISTAVFLLIIAASPVHGAMTGEASRALFERIKGLAGDWNGTSTKGWEETDTVQVIAGGSVVMMTSFDAHPNEHMATMIHLDGDRVILTHYCMAKNQPRLAATSYDGERGTATFEFLDGTGMTSRDTGHMDKVVMHFIDSAHYESRWTWYSKGAAQWLEDIQFTRSTGASSF
jgi:hypothetical protein